MPARPELSEGVVGAPLPPPVEPPPASPLAAVPAWAPFAIMVVVFLLATVAAAIFFGIAEAGGANIRQGDSPPSVIIPATFVQDVLLVVGAYLGVQLWSRGPIRPSTLGVRSTPVWPAIGWTVLAYVTFILLAAIYASLVGKPPEQDLVTELRDQESVLVLGGYAIVVAIGAPLVEETFFRGYMFGVLREKLPLIGAMLIAGTVFGLVHAIGTPVATLPVLVLLGVLFCLLYWRTGSILPGMSLHAINNSVAFASTKGLSVGAGALAVITSVALVLAIANAVIAWERRLS